MNSGRRTVPEGLHGVVAIAAGEKHSLALQADGTVLAWGYNREKQCEVPPGLPKVKAIAAHTWAQPRADHRRQGRGPGAAPPLAVLRAVPPDLADVIQISAGAGHNLALKSNGTVVAWGLNDHGQTDVPADLPKVVSIATGHFHSLALTADGRVIGWGFNNHAQLNPPRDLSHVSAIAAQGWHSAALTADGRVVVWGFNNDGADRKRPQGIDLFHQPRLGNLPRPRRRPGQAVTTAPRRMATFIRAFVAAYSDGPGGGYVRRSGLHRLFTEVLSAGSQQWQ